MIFKGCLNSAGPIDNSDFLCRHGGVLPQKTEHVYDLCVAFPQPVWDLLHSQFGGGPACTRYENLDRVVRNVTLPCTTTERQADAIYVFPFSLNQITFPVEFLWEKHAGICNSQF